MSNRERDAMDYDYGSEAFPPVQPPPVQPPGVHRPQEPYPPPSITPHPPPPSVPRRSAWQRLRNQRWPSEAFWMNLILFVAGATGITAGVLVVFQDYLRMHPLGYAGLVSRAFQVGIWLIWAFGIVALGTQLFRRDTR